MVHAEHVALCVCFDFLSHEFGCLLWYCFAFQQKFGSFNNAQRMPCFGQGPKPLSLTRCHRYTSITPGSDPVTASHRVGLPRGISRDFKVVQSKIEPTRVIDIIHTYPYFDHKKRVFCTHSGKDGYLHLRSSEVTPLRNPPWCGKLVSEPKDLTRENLGLP